MKGVDMSSIKSFEYPPITRDIEVAKKNIDDFGLCLLKNVLNKKEIEVIDTRLQEQWKGEEKRNLGSIMRGDEGFGIKTSKKEKVSRLVWNLVNKGDCFLPLIDHPRIFPLIRHILGETVLMCSIGAHMNGSGNQRMPLHQDQWPLIPHHLNFPAMANVMLLITDNSPENGGTCLIPGSHKWPDISYKKANSSEVKKLAKSVRAPRGTAIIFEGRTWHCNGLNRSEKVRSNISIAYMQPWVRTQENHQYSLRKEVYKKTTKEQREILGFSPFGTLGGHDGSSVSPSSFDRDKESIGILKP